MADIIYKAVPTDVGLTKIQKAMWTETKLPLTKLAYGDGELDTATMHSRTELVNQVGLTDTQSIVMDTEQGVTWVAAIIGSHLPECTIREIGLFDEDGDLCFIANTPEIDKVNVVEGTLVDVPLELGIKNSYAEYVEVPLQPSGEYASKQWVLDVIDDGDFANKSLSNINQDGEHRIFNIAYGPIIYDVYEENVEFELPEGAPDPEEEIIYAADWEDIGDVEPDNSSHESTNTEG